MNEIKKIAMEVIEKAKKQNSGLDEKMKRVGKELTECGVEIAKQIDTMVAIKLTTALAKLVMGCISK